MIIDFYKNYLKTKFKEANEYYIPGLCNYIEEIDKIYEYKYKNISIRVYYRKNKDNINISLIKKVLERASFIYVNKKEIFIHLLLTPLRKIIETPLTSNNVNSGFTYTNNNQIFIYRKEDFPKVILHELIHHDFYIHNDNVKSENESKLKDFFMLDNNSKFILNEAIVELWALLYHLFFISSEYKISFKDLFEIELKYSLYKCYQIFELHKNGNANGNGNKWKEVSNIYAYIICKTILLRNISELIKIYSFPYDDTKITSFIIKNAKLPIIKTNPYIYINGTKIQRDDNSLCFMLLSDL